MARLTTDYGDKIYYNQVMDRGAMRQLIGRLITYLGSNCTAQILDQLKTLGFRHATQAGISLGVDDLITTPSKTWLIRDAEYQAHTSEEQYRRGSIHAVEKLRHVVETWHTTSEYLKREMTSHFRITDPLNPVHIMSFSGARGNVSQVHQLVGMRGLMANPQGNIIDLPIQSNLREGLSLTEYIISCYGARKGVVDTAVRTADAGYLTRRLVEVVQHVVVRNPDCETLQGIKLHGIRDRKTFSSLLSLQERLVGRVLAKNIFVGSRCIAIRNQDLSPDLVHSLVRFQCEIEVRSPLTCKSMPRACQRCYGWDLSCGSLVEIGAAIGIVAGQSIGEPGTQLTLRTFHTGGVFTGGVAEHVRAPLNGIVYFSTKTIQPTRNRHGRPAWTCPEAFSVIIEDLVGKKKILNVPQHSLLLVQNNQYVQSRQIIAEVRTSIAPLKEKIEKHIYSHLQGEVFYNPISLRASCLKQRNFLYFLCSSSRFNLWRDFASIRSYLNPVVEKTSYIWIFSGRFNNFFNSSINFSFFYQTQDYIQKNLPIGLRNHVFNHQKPILFSIYNQPASFLKKFIKSPKIFSKYTGSIHTISEQNDWILTVSFDDQFSSLIVNNVDPIHIKKEKNNEIDQSVLPKLSNLPHTLSNRDLSVGLLGNFFLFFKDFSLIGIRTFLLTPERNLSLILRNKNLWRTIPSFLTNKQRKGFFVKIGKTLESLVYLNHHKDIYTRKTWFLSTYFALWYIFQKKIAFPKRFQTIKIGQSICKGLETFNNGLLAESGQIVSLNENALLIRLAKLYLVPTEAIAHTFHKQAINEGDTLVTLAYERLKASDIIQGLPKAEQLLEARVGNQVVINLYMRFEILVARIKEQLRNYSGSLTQMDLMLSQISINRAAKALGYTQLETVDQVQKVYLSQGVYISDKHFEVIVRQMSGKIAIVENTDFTAFSSKGVIRTAFPYDALGVFFPGELLEISKAQRMNRVLHKPLPCKPVLLGITQASLNANSFLSEASFERTITVLSRSALQGRIDWLKGLKENVLLSKMIPAGTGLQQGSLNNLFSKNQLVISKANCDIFSSTPGEFFDKQQLNNKGQPMVCLSKPSIPKRNWLHSSLKQLTEQSFNYETKKVCLQQLTNKFLPRKKYKNSPNGPVSQIKLSIINQK